MPKRVRHKQPDKLTNALEADVALCDSDGLTEYDYEPSPVSSPAGVSSDPQSADSDSQASVVSRSVRIRTATWQHAVYSWVRTTTDPGLPFRWVGYLGIRQGSG